MSYFSNAKFDALFVERLNSISESDKRQKIEQEMARMIVAMVTNFVRHPFFNGYPDYFKSDLVAEGISAIWVKLDGFDRNKGTNYFAYFTSVSKNAFIAQLRVYYRNKNQSVPMDVMENFLTECD